MFSVWPLVITPNGASTLCTANDVPGPRTDEYGFRSCTTCHTAPKEIIPPMMPNIKIKPNVVTAPAMMARETFLVGFRNSSDWEPNLCAKYAGRSAKPHGLTDETTPAIKANVNATVIGPR